MEISENVKRACAIARGEEKGDDAPVGKKIVAHKDYSSRGTRREHWFALRWSGSAWEYGSERLPSGNFRAADRCASVKEDTYEGDVYVTHDLGKGVDSEAVLVVKKDDGSGWTGVKCELTKLRNGMLRISLPDGTSLERPNPRS